MEKMQVKVDLVGQDSNIFKLMSVFRKAAIRQGYSEDDVDALFEEVKKCDYHQAVGLLLENSVSEDEDEDEDEDGWWNYCDD